MGGDIPLPRTYDILSKVLCSVVTFQCEIYYSVSDTVRYVLSSHFSSFSAKLNFGDYDRGEMQGVFWELCTEFSTLIFFLLKSFSKTRNQALVQVLFSAYNTSPLRAPVLEYTADRCCTHCMPSCLRRIDGRRYSYHAIIPVSAIVQLFCGLFLQVVR